MTSIRTSSKCARTSKSLAKEAKNYANQYNGVGYDKTNKKYMASITYKKCHYLGRFHIAADASWMHDECARIIEDFGHVSINFASQKEYEIARIQELEERGLDVPHTEVLLSIKERADKFRLVVGKSVGGNGKTESFTHHTSDKTFSDIKSPGIKSSESEQIGSNHDIETKPVVSNTIKTEQLASNPVTLNTSKLIKLTAEQADNLRFPLRTPVWWFVGNDGDNATYNEGAVRSVYFEVTSRDLLYEVLQQHGEHAYFLEKDLGYAPPCHVFISPCSGGLLSARELLDQGGDLQNGTALLCKREGEAWVYTASVTDKAGNMKLLENIPSDNVLYCKNPE